MTTKEEIIRVFKKMQDAFLKDTEFRNAIDGAIEILSQPPLPSNLDEAAEEYAYINWESDDYHEGASEGLPFDAIGHTAKCFKAGAEWMARQGWISVDERLPEMDEEVIVLTDELGTAPIYKIAFGHIVDVERCIDYNGWNCPGVKYWMPCPKIPNND